MPKFLVIRLSSMGDIVLASPVVRCLKQQVKDAEIHFLIKKEYLPLVENNPNIDQAVVYEKGGRSLEGRLGREGYDEIIDLHHNLRSAGIRRRLGIKTSSFHKLNFEKWLLVNFKINRMQGLHVVDRYMESVAHLGVRNDGRGLDFFLPADIKAPFDLPAAFFSFVIGGRHATKMLPIQKIIEIIKRLKLPVVLIGGGDDRDAGEKIAALVTEPAVLNGCGRFDLHESAVAIRDSRVVITHDTGMMHVAAAFGKKIVSVWGSTVPAFGMGPYFGDKPGWSAVMQVPDVGCRPCSKIGFSECPQRHFRCMTEQDEKRIAETANAWCLG